jgi:hypothetical protein
MEDISIAVEELRNAGYTEREIEEAIIIFARGAWWIGQGTGSVFIPWGKDGQVYVVDRELQCTCDRLDGRKTRCIHRAIAVIVFNTKAAECNEDKEAPEPAPPLDDTRFYRIGQAWAREDGPSWTGD